VKKRTDSGDGELDEIRIRQPRLTVLLLCHFVVVFLSVCLLLFVHCCSCNRIVEMTERQGWRGKGDKVVRRSPRKGGKTCGRPFTAPRKVTQAPRTRKKRSGTTDKEDSEVQVLTESEVQVLTVLTCNEVQGLSSITITCTRTYLFHSRCNSEIHLWPS
jgi:hypothetical protein